MVDGRLRRVSRDGVVGEPAGVLEDYGCVAEAFCAVHQLTGEGRWLDAGRRAARRGAGPLRAPGGRLLRHRRRRRASWSPGPADPTDNATPSGLSALAAALVAYAALTRRAALPGGGRGGAGHGRADRRPARPLRRVRGRGRRGAAVRPVRDRDRGRRRRPADDRCSRPPTGTPRPARWSWPARPDQPGVPLLADRPLRRRAAHRVRLPGFRLRPAGDHGGRAASASSPAGRAGLRGLVRLAPRWIPGPVCPLSAWWAAASWPG